LRPTPGFLFAFYKKEAPVKGAWVLLVEIRNSLGSSAFQHNGIGVMGCQE
jgi:hypothetical protein